MRGARIRGGFGEGTVAEAADDEIVVRLASGSRKRFLLHELGKIELVDLPLTQLPRHLPNAAQLVDSITTDVALPPALVAWLIAHAPKSRCDIRPLLQRRTLALGNGPLDVRLVGELLAEGGTPLEAAPTTETEVIVVGDQLRDVEPLLDLMECRANRVLSVYSQQMFVAMLATEADPLSGREPGLVVEMGASHSGLKFLSNVLKFDWTSQQVPNSARYVKWSPATPSPGYLAFEGYHTGIAAGPNEERRARLTRCFTNGQVPWFYPEWYRRQWGMPESAERYRKITDSLEAFAANAPIQDHQDADLAISQWTTDLEWFRATFDRLARQGTLSPGPQD